MTAIDEGDVAEEGEEEGEEGVPLSKTIGLDQESKHSVGLVRLADGPARREAGGSLDWPESRTMLSHTLRESS